MGVATFVAFVAADFPFALVATVGVYRWFERLQYLLDTPTDIDAIAAAKIALEPATAIADSAIGVRHEQPATIAVRARHRREHALDGRRDEAPGR